MGSFWFDMDGVIVRYERWAYRGKMIALQNGSNYYKSAPIDRYAVDLLRELNDKCQERVHILTGVPAVQEIVVSKIFWLSKNCPFIDIDTQFHAVVGSKDEYVLGKQGSISTNDILIDDFNANLLSWSDRGGTAVKYLNGVNSVNSYEGYSIKRGADLENVIGMLLDVGKVC